MKLSLSTYIIEKYSLLSNLSKIADLPIKNLEIWGNFEDHFNFLSKRETNKLLKDLNKYDLKVVSLHAPYGLDIAAFDEKERKKNVSMIKKSIDCLSNLNGEFLVLHGSKKAEYIPSFQEKKEKSIISLKEILEYAISKNKKIALENLFNVFFYTTSEKLLDVINKFKSPFLGVCVDVGHINLISNINVIKEISEYQGKIFNIHLSDNDGILDKHLHLNKGNIDWKNIFKKLKKINYQGYYTLEIKHCSNWFEEIKKSIEFAKKEIEE
ncbi:MAG: sugar phosphate isomerase/epimerase family protein [bacterium]